MQDKKDSEKQAIIKRLKSARGHLESVIRMVEDDKYCIDILQQSIAVQNALKRADEQILSRHLESCVKNALAGKQKEQMMKEIVEVFKKGR